MSNITDALFAGIPFRFRDLGNGDFFDDWQWMLDPYRTSEDISPVVSVQKNLDCINAEGGCLLFQQNCGFFRNDVYRAADGGMYWEYVRVSNDKIYIKYYVSADWSRITLLVDETNSAGHMAFEYLNHIMPGVLLNYGILSFHGVFMEHDGRGIIISAPSGTGKTTHARMWRDSKRAIIINGDRVACKKVDNVWTGFGLPWSGTSGEQINRSTPIKAFVVLGRGEENETTLLSGVEAFHPVMPNLLYPNWDERIVGNAYDMIDDFLKGVSVIHLKCRPDLESVDILNQALEEL